MKILGYSERGAMNALFYGMVISKNEAAMREFLNLAGFNGIDYSNFELYMEFSLSEFGDPDLIITADKGKEKIVFFVEAKASCGKKYEWSKEKEKHEKTIDNQNYVKGEASNLFFQLRLKKYFFDGDLNKSNIVCPKKIIYSGKNRRKRGKNNIVNRLIKEVLERCSTAQYIAIIPDETIIGVKKEYGIDIHVVSWMSLYNDELLGPFIKETISFNQGVDTRIKSKERIVSQILNTPIPNLD